MDGTSSVETGRSICEISAALAAGRTSSEALVADYLDRIGRANPRLNAFVALAENALLLARDSDARRRTGRSLGPLDGIPLAVKDVFDVAGLPTRGGSRSRPAEPASGSTASVRRLQDAGMIVLGKTAMVELGLGGWGTQSASPVPWNPWSPAEHRVPGGSSSGSAVAVAAGLAPVALASDFGGSARIPAAFCGIVGFKPSPGRVAMDGAIPVSRTHDTFGLLGRTVEDVRLVFDAVLEGSGVFVGTPGGAGDPLVGGLADDQLATLVPEVRTLYRAALARLGDGVCRIGRFASPESFETYSTLAGELVLQEAYARYGKSVEATPELFCPVVRERILSGRAMRDPDVIIAARQQHQARFTAALREFDLIALPTCPAGAIPVSAVDEARSPSPFTRFANYLDLPALSIPIGVTAEGMPVGLQFATRRNADALLLDFGEAAARALAFSRPRLGWGKEP